MASRIDEKTVVPLGWVLAGFLVGLAPLISGVLWVQAVNLRLGRIEQKLGIPPLAGAAAIFEDARAGGK